MPHYSDDAPGETTALLSNGHRRDGAHAGGHGQWKRFFLNSRSTPGTESPNAFVRYTASTWHITKVTLLSNYVNFLLVIVPLGIIAGELNWDATTVFALNFLAIIPLAAVLSAER